MQRKKELELLLLKQQLEEEKVYNPCFTSGILERIFFHKKGCTSSRQWELLLWGLLDGGTLRNLCLLTMISLLWMHILSYTLP